MDESLFKKFQQLTHQQTGIALSEEKHSMVSSRIAKRMRALNINSEEEYYKYLISEKGEKELISFIDVISTNVTSFFRESDHFDFFSEMLDIRKSRQDADLKIWCAAASSGEEPYTIAMVLDEVFGNSVNGQKILATDISMTVLNQAVSGLYPADKLAEIRPDRLKTYFQPVKKDNEPYFEVNNRLKSLLMFKRLNLNDFPLPLSGPLDFIFCRNVMIYFDNVLKQRLIDNFFKLLKPGGILFISHTESLAGLSTQFKMIMPSVFTKPSH